MNKPQINLDFLVHWCPLHREPLREDWPKGSGVAMIKLFDKFVADKRVIEMTPKNKDGKGLTESLDAIALECSPLCCFVGDDKMREVYIESGVWEED